jgi:hypothetical protein
MASWFRKSLDHTQRRTVFSRTPLDEWWSRRREFYLTTRNIHNRETSMPPVRFELTISAVERPQTYALDRAFTGIVYPHLGPIKFCVQELPIIYWIQQWPLPTQNAQQRQETSIHAFTGIWTRDPCQDVLTDFTATRIGPNRFYRTLLQAQFCLFTSLICYGRKYNSKSWQRKGTEKFDRSP